MVSLQAGSREHQDTFIALSGCGSESPALDSPVPAKRGPGRPPKYATLFDRLKANCEVNEFTGCWEWQGHCNKGGYPIICIRVDGTPTGLFAHRLMLEQSHGVYFPYDEAGHTCNNPCCINPRHLEIQTTAHNMSERPGYQQRNFHARMIPVLYPIPDWAPHPEIVQLLAPVDHSVCPF